MERFRVDASDRYWTWLRVDSGRRFYSQVAGIRPSKTCRLLTTRDRLGEAGSAEREIGPHPSTSRSSEQTGQIQAFDLSRPGGKAPSERPTVGQERDTIEDAA